MEKLWQGLAVISILLLVISDVYFRDLSLLETGKWVGIGFFLTLIGIGTVIALFVGFFLARGKRPQIVKDPKVLVYSLGKMPSIALQEEVICRGPLLAILLIWQLPAVAWTILIIVDGLLFGLVHFVNRPIDIWKLTILSWMGVILSGLVLETTSLVPSIFLHLSLLIFPQVLRRFAPTRIIARPKNTSNPEN